MAAPGGGQNDPNSEDFPKSIAEYFEISIDDLMLDKEAPFDIFLHLPRNNRILCWKRGGENISASFVETYVNRGIKKIWIRNDQKDLYTRYKADFIALSQAGPTLIADAPVSEEPRRQKDTPAPQAEAPKTPRGPQTEQGKKILNLMSDTEIPELRKKAMVAQEARAVVQQNVKAVEPEEVALTEIEARQIVSDIIEDTLKSAETVVAEVWNLANIDPSLDHGVNVSTYAVLFAMAFGTIDRELIADIAIAGVMHDIGLSQTPYSTASKPWVEQTTEEFQEYQKHVYESVELLKFHGEEISSRVYAIMEQHHEQFDGRGYPGAKKAFQFSEISQLLAMADLMESMKGGRYDGKTRTIREALALMESSEGGRNFPSHFNPDLLSGVLKWARDPGSKKSAIEAGQLVRAQAQKLLQK